MEFAEKYYGSYTIDGVVVRAELHEDGFVDSASPRRLVRDGVGVFADGPDDRDVYKAILTSEAEVVFWDEDGAIETTLDDVTDRSHMLVLRRAGTVFYKGYVRPEPVETTLNAFPGQIVVAAQDGLVDLKNTPYVDTGDVVFTGLRSVVQVAVDCLKNLSDFGFSLITASDWWTPDLGGATPNINPLEYIKIPVSVYLTEEGFPISCEQVLLDLCKRFNLQLRQSDRSWHLIQRELLWEPTGYYRHEYDMTATRTAHGLYDPAVTITESDAQAARVWDSKKSFYLGYQATQFTHNHGTIPSLIPNGDFSGFEDIRTRTGRDPQGGENSSVGRGGVLSDPGARGGGDRSRGGSRGGFIGRGGVTGGFPKLVTGWYHEDDTPITLSEIGIGDGPNGENTLHLPGFDGSIQLNALSVWNLVKTTYWYNEGRAVIGGAGRFLQIRVDLFLDIDDTQESPNWFYPFFYQLYLTNEDTGDQLVLSDVFDSLTGRHVWVDPNDGGTPESLKWITFRQHWVVSGEFVGAPAETWATSIHKTNDLSEGVWRVQVRFMRPYDWKGAGGDAEWGLKANEAAKITNVFVDIVDENGIINKSATIFTALNPSSDDLSIYKLESVIGDGLVLETGGALIYDKAEAGSALNGTKDWKVGRYVAESPTGVSIDEMSARALWRQQSRTVRRHDVDGFLSRDLFLHPHQVLDIDGERFQLGRTDYALLKGQWSSALVKVIKTADAPSTQSIDDSRPASAFAANDGVNSLFAILGRNTLSTLGRDYVAKTTAQIPSGLATSISVEMADGAVLNANDKVILIDLAGNDYQFTVTANADETATTLSIDDDALLGSGFNFPRVVDVPAWIFVRSGFIRSLLVQTDNAIRAVVRSMEIGRLNGDLSPAQQVTSLNLKDPIRFNLKDGMPIILSAQTPVYLTVNGDVSAGATSIPIVQEWVLGLDGDSIVFDGGMLSSELLIQAWEVFISSRLERRGGAIGLSNEVLSGSENDILIAAPGAAQPIPIDSDLLVVSEDGLIQKLTRNSAAVAQGATTIPIYVTNFAEAIPAGASVLPAPFSMQGQIKVAFDEVTLRAYQESVVAEYDISIGNRAIAKITQTGNKTGPWTIDPAPEAIEDNLEVLVYVPVDLVALPLGKGVSTLRAFPATVNGAVAKNATSITFDQTLNLDRAPSWVTYKDPAISSRFLTNEGRIDINSNSITSLVAQYDSDGQGQARRIASLNLSYNASRSTIQITGLPNSITIEKYDHLLIWSKDGKIWYEIRATADLTGNGGVQTLNIENPFGGGAVFLNVTAGDPLIFGTFSALRQTIEGFEVHSRFLKSSTFDGSINDEGQIITLGSAAGYAFGAAGHFAFIRNGNNYIWYNGTTLELVFDNRGTVLDGAGITLEQGAKRNGNTIKWGTTGLQISDDSGGLLQNGQWALVLASDAAVTLQGNPNKTVDFNLGIPGAGGTSRIAFHGGTPVTRRSISGVAVQDQIDSIVQALVDYNLANDLRSP